MQTHMPPCRWVSTYRQPLGIAQLAKPGRSNSVNSKTILFYNIRAAPGTTVILKKTQFVANYSRFTNDTVSCWECMENCAISG